MTDKSPMKRIYCSKHNDNSSQQDIKGNIRKFY